MASLLDDDVVAVSDARSVTLLSRVILPRPGEPLDVRKLYIEEPASDARAHALSRTALEIGAESEVSVRHLLQCVPGQLLAPVVDAGSCGVADRTDR